MRAIVVRPPKPGASLEDVPAPSLAAGSVRVAVIECGVCGTDHDIVDGKYGTPPSGQSYLVLGHENLGEVVAVAPGAEGFGVGDLVVATVRRGCGACRFCAVNRSDFCETGRFTERGIAGAHGYMAEEYVDVPEYLVRVPPTLVETAVLLEPLSVVEKAIEQGLRVLDRKEPTPGRPRERPPTALVAGTGAIGMLASLVLTLRGCTVTTIDRHGESTAAAGLLREAGATHVNAVAGLSALGEARFDLVFEATGSATLDFSLLERLGANGVLVLTGIPDATQPPTSVPGGSLLRDLVLGNRAIVGSVNANRKHFEAGLRDLNALRERRPGLCERLVSERRPLSEFHAILDQRAGSSIKTVLAVRAPDESRAPR